LNIDWRSGFADSNPSGLAYVAQLVADFAKKALVIPQKPWEFVVETPENRV